MTITDVCPSCGFELYDSKVMPKPRVQFKEDIIIRALKKDSRRDIYRGRASCYYISYSAGLQPHYIFPATVEKMLEKGILKRKWPDTPKSNTFILAEIDETLR